MLSVFGRFNQWGGGGGGGGAVRFRPIQPVGGGGGGGCCPFSADSASGRWMLSAFSHWGCAVRKQGGRGGAAPFSP